MALWCWGCLIRPPLVLSAVLLNDPCMNCLIDASVYFCVIVFKVSFPAVKSKGNKQTQCSKMQHVSFYSVFHILRGKHMLSSVLICLAFTRDVTVHTVEQ